MSYSAKIILDSISPTGKRLTTFEIKFPSFIHKEFNTHRALSRNTGSSRAIPVRKQIERVLADPFIPEAFPINQPGMQAMEYYWPGTPEYDCAKRRWLEGRDAAVKLTQQLAGFENAGVKRIVGGVGPIFLNVHKQIASRPLELYGWTTGIVTATEWDNFFAQRCDKDAQPEFKKIADLMYDVYHTTDEYLEKFGGVEGLRAIHSPIKAQKLDVGQWHTPYIQEEDEEFIFEFLMRCSQQQTTEFNNVPLAAALMEVQKRVSVARCARVSFLNHSGRKDISKDLELYAKLMSKPHPSPFEHVATPLLTPLPVIAKEYMAENTMVDSDGVVWSGNFCGWQQLRKQIPNENVRYYRKSN